jgi:hypothetical protein
MLNSHFVFRGGAAVVLLFASLLASSIAAQAASATALPPHVGLTTATGASVKGMKLKVSPNGRCFVDQDGKPFFYLGDTIWLLFQRMHHEVFHP